MVCPQGKEGTVELGEADGRLTARFDPGVCEGCPLLGGPCRVEERRRGPTMYVSERSVEVDAPGIEGGRPIGTCAG